MNLLPRLAVTTVLASLSACSHSASAPPNAIADGLGMVQDLTASDGYTYWAEPDGAGSTTWSIRRVTEGGQGSPELVLAGVGQPAGLAADGARVFFTDALHSTLLAAPVSGAANATVVTSHGVGPGSVVLVNGTAFVLTP